MKEQFYNTKIDTTGQLEELIELVEKLGFRCWHSKNDFNRQPIMFLEEGDIYVSGFKGDDYPEYRKITIEELRNALK